LSRRRQSRAESGHDGFARQLRAAESFAAETLATAAVCVIVTVCPATLIVPLRPCALVFGATLKVTLPLPAPLAPAVSVIQGAWLAAVHSQPSAQLTVTLPLPPAAS
jgi:hypothetical protein